MNDCVFYISAVSDEEQNYMIVSNLKTSSNDGFNEY